MDSCQMLSNNTILNCECGNIKILNLIGKGGQGEVYKVEFNGKEYALKYYFENLCTDSFKNKLIDIIDNPLDSNFFLWPLYFVENKKQFGYLMKLKPQNFYNVSELVNGSLDIDLENIIKACLNLCEGFNDLFSSGYSYKDISFGNVCLNPETGEILILDNDNVTVNLQSTGIQGTPGFMAPELVSGYLSKPTRLTDLHSLSVLLFYMTMFNHPLEGDFQGKSEIDFEDEIDWTKFIYGSDTARFIFNDEEDLEKNLDLTDDSQKNTLYLWNIYPERIKSLFKRAFTYGINNPHYRPGAAEWIEAFKDSLINKYACPHCGSPLIFDRKQFNDTNGKPLCPNCNKEIKLPILRINYIKNNKNEKRFIVLNDGKLLYAFYFDILNEHNLNVILAVEINGNGIRFKNMSNHKVKINDKEVLKGEYSDYVLKTCNIYIDNKVYLLGIQ